MRTMPSADESLPHIDHPSFQDADAAANYAAAPAVDEGQTARSFMADEVTRDCARRMHYAAYRAEHADRRHTAALWRQRYYALRESIILGNRKLIYRVVSRYQSGPLADDLVGECHLVMIRAVAACNPWMGVRFSTYACTCLFRALSRVGKRLATGRLCTTLDLDGVAEPMAPVDEPDETSSWPLVVRHLRDDDPLLSVREKRILEHRFGLVGGCGPLTLDQVATDLGISKERVRQLQTGALGKLRQVLLARGASHPM